MVTKSSSLFAVLALAALSCGVAVATHNYAMTAATIFIVECALLYRWRTSPLFASCAAAAFILRLIWIVPTLHGVLARIAVGDAAGAVERGVRYFDGIGPIALVLWLFARVFSAVGAGFLGNDSSSLSKRAEAWLLAVVGILFLTVGTAELLWMVASAPFRAIARCRACAWWQGTAA